MGQIISFLLRQQPILASARVRSGGVPYPLSSWLARLPRLIKACLRRLLWLFLAILPLIVAGNSRAFGAMVHGLRRVAVGAAGVLRALTLLLLDNHLLFFCLFLFCTKLYSMLCMTPEELESYEQRDRNSLRSSWVWGVIALAAYVLSRSVRNNLAVRVFLIFVGALSGMVGGNVADLFLRFLDSYFSRLSGY